MDKEEKLDQLVSDMLNTGDLEDVLSAMSRRCTQFECESHQLSEDDHASEIEGNWRDFSDKLSALATEASGVRLY